MSAPFSIERRVEFGDTDMAGIMHFANFFRFMEIAETAFLRGRGLSVTWHDDASGARFGFPRVSASCDYHAPAHFEDVLVIDVNVERVGAKSVSYRFDFSRDTERLAVGRLTTVYCRQTEGALESLDIPPDLRAKLEA
jgi:YbgC/YbaW family acyl-CoA thioester hydrolase